MTLEDFDHMPYIRAVREIRRVKTVTMVSLPCVDGILISGVGTLFSHQTVPISDTYAVPPESMVIPSFYNSLHDPKGFRQTRFSSA